MGKVLHIWNHARIAQLCWPLGIIPYVVSICWVYILWLASIGSFYMPMCESCWVCVLWLASIWYFHTNVWILFESCWVYISWLASIGCFYTPIYESCLNLAGCASCGLHQLDAHMHLFVHLVSILLGVHIVTCINWMLLYTYVWIFWVLWKKNGIEVCASSY
jgi:hypothetical protein